MVSIDVYCIFSMYVILYVSEQPIFQSFFTVLALAFFLESWSHQRFLNQPRNSSSRPTPGGPVLPDLRDMVEYITHRPWPPCPAHTLWREVSGLEKGEGEVIPSPSCRRFFRYGTEGRGRRGGPSLGIVWSCVPPPFSPSHINLP